MTAANVNADPSSIPPPPASLDSRQQQQQSRPLHVTKRPSAARTPKNDPLSERATVILIRRALCPQTPGDKARAQPPVDELLPPLTSRNDVDLQLYAFLAIILREFVQNWYNKITPDETFVSEVILIIAHCTRALEQRFRKLDLESLLLDEIPDLLEKHVKAYRVSRAQVSQPPVEVNPRQVYHSLYPLPFLSPVPSPDEGTNQSQLKNERVYRQLLVEAVLAVLLPTEDLENPCLTALVEQIFSEMIIGNVIANKAAQPWLLYEAICISARILDEKKSRAKERIVSGRYPREGVVSKQRPRWSVQGFFLFLIQIFIILTAGIRFLVSTVVMSSSLPPRLSVGEGEEETDRSDTTGLEPRKSAKVPVVSFRVWSCLGSLAQLEERMPWAMGTLSLLQHGALWGPGHLANMNGPLDRLLSYHIHWLFLPSHLAPFLRTLRGALFPNNAPGKSALSPPATPEQFRALRRRAATALWGLLPKSVGRLYFGGGLWRRGTTSRSSRDDDTNTNTNLNDDVTAADADESRMVDEVEELLMVIDDEYCNKHLMYGALELILVRLMPELAEKGVQELWDERLGQL